MASGKGLVSLPSCSQMSVQPNPLGPRQALAWTFKAFVK